MMVDLPLVVDSLDAVEEPYRALYQEADGRFQLPFAADIDKLKKTAEATRQERDGMAKRARELETHFNDLKHQIEDLGDLDQIKEVLAEREEAKEKEAKEKHTVEDYYRQQIEGLTKKHQAELAKKDALIAEREKLLMKRTLAADLAEAVAEARPVDWLRQHTELWLERQAQVKQDDDGEYRTYAEFSDGELKPLKEYAALWSKTEEGQKFTRGPEMDGGGGGTVNGGAGSGANPFTTGNLTEQGKLLRENPGRYEQLKRQHDAKHRGLPSYNRS